MKQELSLVVTIAAAVLTALTVAPVSADRFVSEDGGNAAPYDSWATAATDIKTAVDYANAVNAGDVVWVTNGTYVLSVQVTVSNTIVRGLSGNPADVVVDGNGAVRGFYLNHASALVQHLTISNGVANADPSAYYGGGACVELGTLRHCVLTMNTASTTPAQRGYGGGAYCGQVGALIEDCVFSTNTTGSVGGGQGGGARVADGWVVGSTFINNVGYQYGGGLSIAGQGVVSNCTFTGNRTLATGSGGGGGVHLSSGLVVGSMIVSNVSAREGGGAYVNGGSAVLMNSTSMWNSTGTGGYGWGSGVHVNDGLVIGCTIASNTCTVARSGAGVYMAGTATVERCTIVGNWSTKAGAGVACVTSGGRIIESDIAFNTAFGAFGAGMMYQGTGVLVQDCNISSNMCVDNGATMGGAGAYITGGGMLMDRCTIAGNSGRCRGGGLLFNGTASSTSTARNCRITGNVTGYSSYEGGGGVMFYNSGAKLIGCLITDNLATNGAVGGGITIMGNTGVPSFINCTVVSNTAANTGHGGGISFGGRLGTVATGVVVNCIVYSNRSSTAADYNWYLWSGSSSMHATNSCTTPSISACGPGNIIDDPLFVDTAAGDYRLAAKSTCIDTGLTEIWMNGMLDLDEGNRVQGTGVDMGAYESVPPPGGTVVLLR